MKQVGFLLILMIILGITCTAYASEGANFGPQTTSGEHLWRLFSASDAVNSNLSKIETALVDASLVFSETGIDGPAARAVLSNLTMVDTAAIDCITVDANGTVREVEPVSFESVKGANLRRQKHVNDTINTRLYSGFHFIKAVEGLYAIDSEMPIFDKNGTFVGTVSLMFNNSQFFGRVLAPFQPSGNSKIWVSKADDGTILYETDPTQVLLNKSSPMYQDYPELLKLFNRMSIERTGYGTYEFLDQSHGETIKKGCYWTTIPNRGTEMRLVLTLEL
ncbi:MAG: cache domain-containing protein [Methanotrichaceae archaeon]|nr:cache domain-containing protein [Methanotrichaceae archaeon]